MSLHAPSPAPSTSAPQRRTIVWLESELDAARDALRRADARLRFETARLEMLREERVRLHEDAKQLEEILDPALCPAPGLAAQRAFSRRALRRFVEKRRGITQVDRMIDEIEESIRALVSLGRAV